MTERDQWRFQWPDGTWIRWNPQTQSWEKEEDQEESSPAPPQAATPPPITPRAPSPSGWKPAGASVAAPSPEPEPVSAAPESPEPSTADLLAEDGRDDVPETPEPRISPEARPAPTGGRRGVAEVIPPRAGGPERPGGSLWPTVLAGAVVGLGVGLLLSNTIR